jgi:glycine cleavage system pyridoxal-binding protein P
MGKEGLREISKINHLNTAYFVREIAKFSHVDVRYKKNFYNEIVLKVKDKKIEEFIGKLEEKGILAGIPLKWFFPDFQDSILINFTELHKKKDIDKLIEAIGELK